jgi:hypothetical protein
MIGMTADAPAVPHNGARATCGDIDIGSRPMCMSTAVEVASAQASGCLASQASTRLCV